MVSVNLGQDTYSIMGNTVSYSSLLPLSSHPWRITRTGNTLEAWDPVTSTRAQGLSLEGLSPADIAMLELRVQHSRYFVSVVAVLEESTNKHLGPRDPLCVVSCLTPINIILLVEDIKYRLPDVGTLEPQQTAYILNQVLQGLAILSGRFPQAQFAFDQEMIGFDHQGQCKFWLSANYFWLGHGEGRQAEGKVNCYQLAASQIVSCLQNRTNFAGDSQKRQKYYALKASILGPGDASNKIPLPNYQELASRLVKAFGVESEKFYIEAARQQPTLDRACSGRSMEQRTRSSIRQDGRGKISLRAGICVGAKGAREREATRTNNSSMGSECAWNISQRTATTNGSVNSSAIWGSSSGFGPGNLNQDKLQILRSSRSTTSQITPGVHSTHTTERTRLQIRVGPQQ